MIDVREDEGCTEFIISWSWSIEVILVKMFWNIIVMACKHLQVQYLNTTTWKLGKVHGTSVLVAFSTNVEYKKILASTCTCIW